MYDTLTDFGQWGLVARTAPAEEPVTLEEAKAQARVDSSDEDTYIRGLITSARRHIQRVYGRITYPESFDLYMTDWPSCDRMRLVPVPLLTADYLKYTDSEETSTTVDSGLYVVNTAFEPGEIVLRFGRAWPNATLSPSRPIRAGITCGYARFSGTVTISGAGLTITRASGDLFDTTWTVGSIIRIAGVALPIASVASTTVATLATATASTGTVAYSYCDYPVEIKQAMLLLISYWYDRRVAVDCGDSAPIPYGVEALMSAFPRPAIFGTLNRIAA